MPMSGSHPENVPIRAGNERPDSERSRLILHFIKADDLRCRSMQRGRLIRQLAKAVLFGALTACAPIIAFELVVLITANAAFVYTLTFAAAFFVIAVGIIFCASVLLGLPLTIMLRHRGLESGRKYAGFGAALGALVALVLIPAILGVDRLLDSYAILVPLSALSGSVTAWTWWRSRRSAK
jgi:hypothetical protein